MKIVADVAIPYVNHFFSAIGDVYLHNGREINADIVRDADVLITRTVTRVNQSLLENTSVKYVATATSGIDHIDTAYLKRKNIGFASSAGCNARSVAEYVLSSLFVLAEQQSIDLRDKQIGIIGCGHVGSTLLGFLQACGITCIVTDPLLQQISADNRYQELDKALSADIISLHVPLTSEGPHATRDMVNAQFLKKLKRDAIFINTSRGEVVDELALLTFLENNPDARVVLDVWQSEPAIDPNTLLAAEIATPHIAGYSTDAKLRGTTMVFEQVCKAFDLKTDETVSPKLPDNEVREVRIDGENEMTAIQLAVLASYDVRSDAASMRRLLEYDEIKRASLFDTLRYNYPVRREFSAMNITLKNGSAVLQQKLKALGFCVKKEN